MKKKWLAFALAAIMVLGIVGGVAAANGPPHKAAPAVANELLREQGIRGAGRWISQVARQMGPQAEFEEVSKWNVFEYRDAVRDFLEEIMADWEVSKKPDEKKDVFSPKDIDGLFLWLDAGKGITKDAGANVNRWADQSGNGNHAVAAEGKKPILIPDGFEGDHPVVWFDGNQVMYTPIQPDENDFEDGVTVFLVASFFDAGFALGSWDEPYFYMGIWEDSDEDYRIETGFGDDWETSNDSVTLPGWRILEMINDGEETVVYDNGEEVSAYESTFSGTNNNYLAIGNANEWDYYFEGDIAEILIYKGALDEEDREAIEDYLEDKYF